MSTFVLRCNKPVETALVEHPFELGFDTEPVKVEHKALHSPRGSSNHLELLLGVVFHISVFGAEGVTRHTKQPSLCRTIADPTASLFQVSSVRRVRRSANFFWARCRGELVCYIPLLCSKRHRSVGQILLIQHRRVQFFQILVMLGSPLRLA